MRKVTRNNIIWNVMSGSLNSVYSVICLMIITRVLGVYEAGIFTIAYAIANLFLMIGNYGIRTFQVSDIKSFFHWREYYTLRIITIFFMLQLAIIQFISLW